jgi:Na+-transporting NADH:ubiquinone oxidoreductase subunit C
MQRDSIKNVFVVAIGLCLVCSILVSSMAVGLRPIQQQQREAFRQESILRAAGLWDEDKDNDPGELYKKYITPIVVDLETNKATDRYQPGDKELDAERAMRDPNLSDQLEAADDIAGIRKLEKYSTIYAVEEDGRIRTLILPIRGYGLWSTLWGFIALDVSNTSGSPTDIQVAGLTYYKHGETPGLGGEVDNPLWKEKWPGKTVFDSEWNVLIEVSKGATGDTQVDALSGATLTSNGVTNMLQFWLGDQGFGPYLKNTVSAGQAAELSASLEK